MMRTLFLKKKQLLLSCVLISICLHFFIILTLYNFPYLLTYPLGSLFKSQATMKEGKKADTKKIAEKQKELDAGLQKILVSSGNFQKPFDYSQNPLQFTFSPFQEAPVSSHFTAELSLHPEEEKNDFLVTTALEIPNSIDIPLENVALSSFETPSIPSYLLTDQLEVYLAADQQKNDTLEKNIEIPKTLSPKKVDTKGIEKQSPLPSGITPPSEVTPSNPPLAIEYTQKQPLYFPKNVSPGPALRRDFGAERDDYSLLDTIHIQERSDFDVEIKIAQKEGEEGYLFTIAFQPKFPLEEQAIKQHFYFLIDRSSTVEKHRYNTFKKATLRALSVINPEDTFTIVLFDKKIISFGKEGMAPTEKNIRLAEQFLNKHDHAGYFSSTDVYSSLERILPEATDNKAVYTAILLSSGTTSLSATKQKEMLSNWQKKNQGKVAIYAAATSTNNNLLLLDLLSKSNRGKLLYSDTHAAFPRKLTKLISTLSHPIAQDLVATTCDTSDDARIVLFSGSYHLPNLYYDEPFTVVGKINKLEDFTILLEGRDKNDWFVIKQPILIKEALSKKPLSVMKQYASEEAYIYYNKFLIEGDEKLLLKAKQILKSSGSEVALP